VSVVVVLVTVTLSVRPEVLLLLPLVRATINSINTAPPTIQTHGSVYQVVVVVVEEVDVAVTVLSCAHAIACEKVSSKSRKAFLTKPGIIECFIFIFFGLKKSS
jgi:hypothetical protein